MNMETIWKKGFKPLILIVFYLELRKITLAIIVIASAVIIGFGVWTITPYFTNTTIDEPLPTSLVLHPAMEPTMESNLFNALDNQCRTTESYAV